MKTKNVYFDMKLHLNDAKLFIYMRYNGFFKLTSTISILYLNYQRSKT